MSALPVVVACGARGNVPDLLFTLGSTFGLTALIALGRYVRDRVRGRLGHRRAPLIAIKDAVCTSDALCRSGDPTSMLPKMAMESRSR